MDSFRQNRQAGQLPQGTSEMGNERIPGQKNNLQTDSPASARPRFRMCCQVAASNSWDLFHIDLKRAFLQRQS